MSNTGIKISLPGYDVTTATPEQCSIHSSYPSPKIEMDASPAHFGTLNFSFSVNLPKNSNVLLYTIEHGYDYIPWVIGSGYLNSGGVETQGIMPISPAATLVVWLEMDDTEVRLYARDEFTWIQSGATLEVSYYIFAEEIET